MRGRGVHFSYPSTPCGGEARSNATLAQEVSMCLHGGSTRREIGRRWSGGFGAGRDPGRSTRGRWGPRRLSAYQPAASTAAPAGRTRPLVWDPETLPRRDAETMATSRCSAGPPPPGRPRHRSRRASLSYKSPSCTSSCTSSKVASPWTRRTYSPTSGSTQSPSYSSPPVPGWTRTCHVPGRSHPRTQP